MADQFEENMKKLEDIVKNLEKGDLSLDDMLKYFEQGIHLSNACSKQLTEAEAKVNILVNRDGTMEKQTFSALDEG